MKILSWNVNSIRVRKDQLLSVIKKENPDIICLQETKTMEEAIFEAMVVATEVVE